MSGQVSNRAYKKMFQEHYPELLGGFCVSQKVSHRQQASFCGTITQVIHVSGPLARANGADKNAFTMYAVKWDGKPKSIPAAIHVDNYCGYRASELEVL